MVTSDDFNRQIYCKHIQLKNSEVFTVCINIQIAVHYQ